MWGMSVSPYPSSKTPVGGTLLPWLLSQQLLGVQSRRPELPTAPALPTEPLPAERGETPVGSPKGGRRGGGLLLLLFFFFLYGFYMFFHQDPTKNLSQRHPFGSPAVFCWCFWSGEVTIIDDHFFTFAGVLMSLAGTCFSKAAE